MGLNFGDFLAVPCKGLCLTLLTQNPARSQILYNVHTPMIIARFSFFFEDFVIGCNEFSELGCAAYVTL